MDFAGFFVLALHEIQSLEPPVAKPPGSHRINPYFAYNKQRSSGTSAIRKTTPNLTNSRRYAIISTAKRYFSGCLIPGPRVSKPRGYRPSRDWLHVANL